MRAAILSSRAAAVVITAAVTAATVCLVPINSDLSRAQAIQLHRSHSLTLWMQARTGEELYQASDISQRLSHYTEQRPPGVEVLLCPECTEGKKKIGGRPPHFIPPDAAVDLTSDAARDAREIRANAASLYLQARTQRAAIAHTLNRLRSTRGSR